MNRLRRNLSLSLAAALIATLAIVRIGPLSAAAATHRAFATHRGVATHRGFDASLAAVTPIAGYAPSARLAALTRTGRWVAAWGAAPQAATPATRSATGLADQTLRQIVFSSAGGTMVRVHFANTFGTRPLAIGRAAIGVQGAGARLTAGSGRALTFAGRSSTLIPPGAEVVSDPVALRVAPLDHLAVTVYLPWATGPATQHFVARQVNYLAHGDHALDPAAGVYSAQTDSWFFLSAVDVLAPVRDRGAIVALGDSITDGVGSPMDADARWPNDLARRLAARGGPTMSVVDEGIGGNRVLNDSICCGVDAVARFPRDVLGQTGVRDVILLEGINDIGYSRSVNPLTVPHTDVSAQQIIDGDEQIIALAHADGLRIFGATLTPFEGARYWTPANEAKREAVNRWITTSGAFDGVIDFAGAVADAHDPLRLAPAYDSGDHLHPDAAGYRAMAAAINLGMLLRSTP